MRAAPFVRIGAQWARHRMNDLLQIWDAAAFKKAIRYRHRNSVVIEELRVGCGFGGGSERSIDVWAIDANSSKGCTASSYEIKVSRSDFLRDVKCPLKQRGARLFSDQFWFVTPVGLVKPEEIPDWAGLLEPYPDPDCQILRQVVSSPYRSKDAPSWQLVVSMLRREAIISNNGQEDDDG